MTRRFLVQTGSVVTSILLTLGVSVAADQVQPRDESSAYHFLTEAAQGSLAEVSLGQMAADKSENEAVKSFGRRMVRDHGKAHEEIKGLARAAGVPLPTEMSPEAKVLQQRLGALSGAEFDRDYMEEMVNDHKEDIVAFEKQAEQGQNVQVKEWARKTLPTLKEHLSLAQSTERRVSAPGRREMDASGGIRASANDSQPQKETGKVSNDQ